MLHTKTTRRHSKRDIGIPVGEDNWRVLGDPLGRQNKAVEFIGCHTRTVRASVAVMRGRGVVSEADSRPALLAPFFHDSHLSGIVIRINFHPRELGEVSNRIV